MQLELCGLPGLELRRQRHLQVLAGASVLHATGAAGDTHHEPSASAADAACAVTEAAAVYGYLSRSDLVSVYPEWRVHV